MISFKPYSRRLTPLFLLWVAIEGCLSLVAFADPFAPSGKSQTRVRALMRAIRSGRIQRAKCLIRLGVDTNAYDGEVTPLIEAVRWSEYSIAERLLQSGAQVNLTRKTDGFTPLMVAINGQHTHEIDLLLRWNADVAFVSKTHTSAILLAKRKLGDVYVHKLERVLARRVKYPHPPTPPQASPQLMRRREGK